MRTIIPIIALLFGMGCATTPTGQRDIAPTIKTAAYIGTAYALVEHPEWRMGFETAVIDLRVIQEAEKIDLASVMAVVARLPLRRMQNDKATILVTAAIILLSDYGNALPPDQMEKLRPIAKALKEGIELGLGPRPTTLGKATI